MEGINQEIVDKIKNKIINKSEKTPFMQTRLGIFLSTDWADFLIDKIAYRMYLRRLKKEREQSVEELDVIYVAEESSYIPSRENINDEPQMIEEDENGNLYYTYPNNIVEMSKPKFIFRSIFPSIEIQNEVMDYLRYLDEIELDKRKKKLFVQYLDLSEEEIVMMSWESIDEAIFNKYIKTHRWKKKVLEGDKLC